MWHVYEIVGNKAGCVREDQLERRQRVQKDKGEMIIRSTHSCIYEASDAEIALQKLKGYRVDRIPYWKFYEMYNAKPKRVNIEGCSRGGRIGGRNGSKKDKAKAGKRGGYVSAQGPNHTHKQKRVCPNCGKENNPGNHAQHIKKCI